MLTVFNGADGYPISNDDYYVRELASGLDEIVFNVSIRDEVYKYIREEARIRDRDENYYLIKQIDAGKDRAKVVAQIDIDPFKSAMYQNYTNGSATVYNTVLSVLPAGWTCTDHTGFINRRTIPTGDTTTDYNVTAWKVLQDCCNVYKVRFRFDNVNKIVHIINPKNASNIGAFATRDLNLRELNYKGKSTNFATRLYAEGADGLTFADINDGKNYIDNNEYTDKIISYYWKDERYKDAQSLLEDAVTMLADLAAPARSYDCDVLDLANTNPDMYGFEDFSLFSIITLIDDAKGERYEYQIVEKWNYPYYPVNNKVVLSTETPKIQSQVISLTEAVNSPTSAFQQIMQSAISNSTALITGNKGGYVVFHDSNNDGTPDEILIMDTPDIETATKVWRWNRSGLGYSNTGYDGTYGLAMTIDGSIVADFITTGSLDGGIIRAGSLEVNAFSDETKQELGAVHDYLPYDIATNAARWTPYGTGSTQPYITTYNGKDVIAFDGTNVQTYSDYIYAYTPSDFLGHAELNAKLTIMFSDDFTPLTAQDLIQFAYKDENGSTWLSYSGLTTGKTYEAGVEYSFDIVKRLTNHNAVSNQTVRIVFHPDVIMYVKTDLSVKGTQSSYEHAALSVSPNGLSSIVQSGNIISTINQSAESVSINANKIDLTGNLNLKGVFKAYSTFDPNIHAELSDGKVLLYNTTDLGQEEEIVKIGAEGSGTYVGGFVRVEATDGTQTTIWTSYIDTPKVTTKEIITSDSFIAQSTCNFSVVGTARFYNNVYNASGGTVFVSDKRKKKNIKDLAIKKAKSFIMALKPREFKFKKDISTSDRKHHGFVAQEVKEAMQEDWGVYIEDKENDFIGLRYDELIADMVAVIQEQEKRIDALERKLKQ